MDNNVFRGEVLKQLTRIADGIEELNKNGRTVQFVLPIGSRMEIAGDMAIVTPAVTNHADT